MINLIKNEYIKIGKYKIAFLFILFTMIVLIQYYLNKRIIMNNSLYLIPFVSLIMCIFFSGIFSSEMIDGTFRMYLTKGVSRKKIFLSKVLSIFILSFILTSYILILYYIIIKDISCKFIIKYYIYTIPIYFVNSMTILLSVLIKNIPINLGLCTFFIVFSGTISEYLFKNSIKFIEYLFLPYLDFTIFLNKTSINLINQEYSINLNIYYGIYINILFSIIFIIIGYFNFIKKDIKY